MTERNMGPLTRLFRFFASLKLAVTVILGLAASLATATVLESLYDTPTAQYWVYRALWFHVLLALLGLNIFVVALSRWPWKPRHTPFLLAHLGILILLFGSWVTEKYGLDGSMRVSEAETTSSVDIDSPEFVMTEGEAVRIIPIRWLPPDVGFKPFSVSDYGIDYDLRVDRFLSHADPNFSFVPRKGPALGPGLKPIPAVKLRLTGGPMRISQDFWLWLGDPGWSAFQAGAAWLELKRAGETPPGVPAAPPQGPKLSLTVGKDGSLSYRAESSDHKVSSGHLRADEIGGKTIHPGWKGVDIRLEEWIPDATANTTFTPSRTQYGDQAPPSAIHVVAGKGGEGSAVWLGIGSRAVLHVGDKDVEIGYFNKRVELPFAVRLDRFTVDHYEGTQNPSAYSSRVTVFDRDPQGSGHTISMNEPLQERGITLYQASYEDALPRPVTSILSVNRDPGRRWKYLGSLLIVLGSILLFAMKYRKRKPAGKSPANSIPLEKAEGVQP